jgi:hypothetical protein
VKRRDFLTGIVYSVTGFVARAQGVPNKSPRSRAKGPLRPHPQNPRYFTDGTGKAVYLSGAHTWANLQDTGVAPVPKFDWDGYLKLMLDHNHNFMRLWSWEQAAWAPWTPDKILFEPVVYQRTGPGTAGDGAPKFDLTKFNPAYFDRMRQRVTECRDKGIYVAVMLFQGFSSKKPRHCGDPWPAHPYNKDNNINEFNGDKDDDHVVDIDEPEVRKMHAAYVKKVVDTVNDLDNVLYEVINEGGGREWEWWVADTVHSYEKEKGKSHPVGITGHGAESLEDMLASPADWISPGSRDRNYKMDPPAWDGSKVAVLDTDHMWGHGGSTSWVWKSYCRGYNTLLMDAWDPIAGKACPEVNWGPLPGYPKRDLNRRDDPTWEPVRMALGNVRYYSTRMDLVKSVPSDKLASTNYCLSNPGNEYLVYLPEGDEVFMDLSGASGSLDVEWMHPVEGVITKAGRVKAGGKRVKFPVPFLGAATLYLSKG